MLSTLRQGSAGIPGTPIQTNIGNYVNRHKKMAGARFPAQARAQGAWVEYQPMKLKRLAHLVARPSAPPSLLGASAQYAPPDMVRAAAGGWHQTQAPQPSRQRKLNGLQGYINPW